MLRSLFLDLNSYFASCEQQLHPELRGKPVGVVPMLNVESTSLLAASYPAKAFGIKTGTSVGDAKRLCPDIVLVKGDHADYIRIHHQIIAAVETVLPVHKVWSVDEMECRLLGKEREPENAAAIARRVKAAIRDQVGECLTCSIGLAPNRMLAKLGTDLMKPDGLVMFQASELPDRLRGLDLRALFGVGPRMEKRLNDVGIMSVSDMIDRSEAELVRAFGSVHGSYWWHWLRGHDLPEKPTRTASVGHQHVLPPDERTLEGARAVLVRLLHKAAVRLRQKQYLARTLYVFVRCLNDDARQGGAGGGRWGGNPGWERHISLGVATDDSVVFTRAFAQAWADAERMPAPGEPGGGGLAGRSLLMVGVTLVDLEPLYGTTMSLFEGPAAHRPGRKLGQVMDKVNAAFGKGTIYPASMHAAKDSAPMRIAFRSIPDLDLAE